MSSPTTTAAPLKVVRLSTVTDLSNQLEQVTFESIPLWESMLHAIVGEGEAGKTWIAAHAVLDVVRKEQAARVLVLDGEMSAPAWKRRLLALGATVDELDQVLYAEMTDSVIDVRAVVDTCNQNRSVALIVWDSALSMLSRVARSENDNAEVARVYDKLREIVRQTCAAGLIVDHTTRGSGTLISRGATAKFNSLDMSYGVRVAEGSVPSPIEPWSSIISVEKDRHGLLGKRADREASFFPIGSGALDLSITELGSATHRLSGDTTSAKIRRQLDQLDPPPESGNDAFRRLGGNRPAVLATYKLWKEATS